MKQLLVISRPRTIRLFIGIIILGISGLFLASFVPKSSGGDPPAQTQSNFGIRKVVIDAGHGGKDPGNLGTGRYKFTEKNVALAVALKLGKYIEEKIPDVEVIYTRDDDTFIGLRERCEVANKAGADLFISIHCNAFSRKEANGTETYVMGLHKSKANLEVAQRENASIYLEENYEENYSDFDPNSDEQIIARTMMQSAFRGQSFNFSRRVQEQFETRVKRYNRGVKEAGFVVISYTTMPSVLIELGFLTNKDEEDFLNSDAGQDYMASAIFRAFKEFKVELDGVNARMQGEGATPPKAEPPVAPPVEEAAPEKAPETAEKPAKGKKEKKAEKKAAKEKKPKAPAEKTTPPEEETAAKSEKTPEAPKTEKKTEPVVAAGTPVYKIQLQISPERIATTPANFKGLEGVTYYKEGSNYKYTVGEMTSFEEAVKLQRDAREKGFNQAFIVAFLDGKRIPTSQALKITKSLKTTP
ncbi:MAG: N-acetylmuramoyl-L-alanine amidase [Salibacteraceae bacterium]